METGFFLSVIVPHRSDVPAPALEEGHVEGGRAVEVGAMIVAAPVPSNLQKTMTLAGSTVVADLAILDARGRVLLAVS